jgi:hypothetical protein
MVAKRNTPAAQPPEFYHRLARMAPGSAGIVEAPFIWEAPYELFGYYATFHRQREWMGMLYDVCLVGDRVGEVPHDRRFRFRRFVYLDDVRAVKATGARYLLLHRREPRHVGPHYDNHRCIEKLTPLYGAPIELDERLAVFDLRPDEPPPTLQ